MTAFPAIEPDTREYDLAGDFPTETESMWPGVEIHFRTGSLPGTSTALQLTLGFDRRRQSVLMAIRNHYVGQRWGASPFTLPPIIWQGHAPQQARPGSLWRYIKAPEEPRRGSRLGTAKVELELLER